MFEKEAKKWVKEHTEIEYKASYGEFPKEPSATKSFKAGAEFGYNKAKEDADKMKSQFLELCNLKDMRIAELEKANEWHYVKDGLPPIKKEYNGRSELVLVLSKEKEMQYAQYVEKEKTWARGICEINFKPYAWKEIVLPELPKESE